LDRIVGRLLAFGRPALADRHVQDPMPLIEHAVQMVGDQARRKEVKITVTRQSDAGLKADVDGPQLQQVLINLLLNAIDASPRGDHVDVVAESQANHVTFRVVDHGQGIPDEARPHVFDVYFTTKPDGVGLGLSVSREIVINHGGTLVFSSQPGQTEFVMTMPAARS
jgi:signal transduction histidine kinase